MGEIKACGECGKPILPRSGRGRPRSYCSPECSAAAKRKRSDEHNQAVRVPGNRCPTCGHLLKEKA